MYIAVSDNVGGSGGWGDAHTRARDTVPPEGRRGQTPFGASVYLGAVPRQNSISGGPLGLCVARAL